MDWRSIAFCLLLGLALPGSAQFKYERETRIDPQEVPEQVRGFLGSLNTEGRIRWYRERSYSGESIEAKARLDGRKVSIEFKLDGALEDVEVEVLFETLPKEIQEHITKTCSEALAKPRVRKVQLQYSGAAEAVGRSLLSGAQEAGVTLAYELMVSGRAEDGHAMFEFLFDTQGGMLRRDRVLLRNADNIIY